MTWDFWYIELPAGAKLRRESIDDAANRELNELVDRGWEPISVTRATSISGVGFLMKRPKDTLND